MSSHYTFRAEWSAEDNEYVGLVAEFPSLSWLAADAVEAIAGVSHLVDDILADMETTGETPPVPLSERRYSGNIALRTSSDQHRRLAIEAAEQGVSLNQWVIYKLSTAPRQSGPQSALFRVTDTVRKMATHVVPNVHDQQRSIRVLGPGIGTIGRPLADVVVVQSLAGGDPIAAYVDPTGVIRPLSVDPPNMEGTSLLIDDEVGLV